MGRVNMIEVCIPSEKKVDAWFFCFQTEETIEMNDRSFKIRAKGIHHIVH